MAEERIPLIETVDLKKYFKVGDKSYLHAVNRPFLVSFLSYLEKN